VVEVMERRQMLSATLTTSQSLMVFNAVENSSASATETLTLTDTGNAALTLGSSAFSLAVDPSSSTNDTSLFTLLNASAAPATLAPGASFGLEIDYNATALVTNKAFLDIATNDSVNPTQQVSLHGIGTKGLGGSNQPSLATILQAYNIPIYVGEGYDDDNAATDSIYPNPPDASSQEVVMQRFVKAGTGPVTIDVLASFTASGFAKSYTLGTYTPGEPTTLNELFYTPSNENQTTYVQPQGSTSFDPGSNTFGFYFISNVQVQGRVGYSEDSLNTWDTTNPRKMRFFPMEEPDGTIVPNEYIMTSTEWNAPSGYDFTNIVAIVSNITAAPSAPTAPVLGLQNLNAEPGSTTMVFNRIQGQNPSIGDVVHDTGTLQVNNTGGSPLTIDSATLSDTTNWEITSPTSFPATVAAGGTLAITIKFIAQSEPSVPYNETNSNINGGGGGVYDANLVLTSNDPNNPTATVPLRGWWQEHSENDNEPGIQTIINLMEGWDTYVDSSATATTLPESSNTSGSVPTYYGEEVVSPYWQEADPSQKVTVQQIASYHTEGNTAKTSYYFQGSSGSLTTLFTTASDDGQTLFPLENGSSSLAINSFSTTGTFGFNVDGLFTQDSLNVNSSSGQGGGHHFRFYPIRNANGTLVPNDYIMAFDYATSAENYDFQDTMYVVTNIRPAVVVSGVSSPQSTGAPPAPTDIVALSSSGTNTITWAAPLYTNLAGYNIFRGSSSATGSYTQINTSLVTGTSYTDSSAPATGTSYYKVVAVDSNTGLHSLGDITSVTNTGTPTSGNGDPVAAAESATTSAATPVTINVAAAATDNANGTIVDSSVAITTAPANGQTSINTSTGTITYTPTAGFTGTDTFQYTISDTTGAVSAPATITIIVTSQPIGDPIAANLSFEVAENKSLDFNVSTAATDNSNATIVPTSVAITQAPSHGTATVDSLTGNILYTPNAGFTGTDTLIYTIGDSLQAVSSPATVTLKVSANAVLTGPVTQPVTTTVSTTGGQSLINVLSSATDSSGTLNAASVAISAEPLHGTATVNLSTGAIVYTPYSGYVGPDSLQYTVSDSQGLVSAPSTVTVNDGITINNSTAKSLTFTDASGSLVTLSLTGGGSALLSFTGSGSATTKTGPHGTGTVTLTGTGLGIDGISVTGTTIASTLTVSRKRASSTTLGNISVAGAIGKIVAPTTTLTGNINISGGISSIQSAAFTNATITIGSTGARPGGITVTTGDASGTTLTSALAIKSLKATQWLTSETYGSITAPSISSLVITGEFLSGITTTALTSPFSLGTVHIGGLAGGIAWSITGATSNIVIGSVTSNFTAAFSGPVNSITIKSGGFSGNISAGAINSLSITGDDSGKITAGSIKSARVVGYLNGASITLTNGVAPRATSLGKLQVTGATDDSTILSDGSIGSISTSGIDASSIEAGIASGVTLPSSAGSFTAAATLSSFSITGRGNTFTNTDIAAQTIGSLNLGTITTANKAVPFGIAGGTIGSLSAALNIGGTLRMNKTVLETSTSISTYLTYNALSLGDFVIRPGL
jgi:hypothetical protein